MKTPNEILEYYKEFQYNNEYKEFSIKTVLTAMQKYASQFQQDFVCPHCHKNVHIHDKKEKS